MIYLDITPGEITVSRGEYTIFEAITELTLGGKGSVIIDVQDLMDLIGRLGNDEVILTEDLNEQ